MRNINEGKEKENVSLSEGTGRWSRLVKRALNLVWNAHLNEALELQAIALTESLATDDVKEGRQAFREKRIPNFRGK